MGLNGQTQHQVYFSFEKNVWVPMEIGQIRFADGNILYYIKKKGEIIHQVINNQPIAMEGLQLHMVYQHNTPGGMLRNWKYTKMPNGKISLLNHSSKKLCISRCYSRF